jgi:ribose 5-phosphate isomerase RpiB
MHVGNCTDHGGFALRNQLAEKLRAADHMNIICLSGRIVGPELAWDLVAAFLAVQYSQAERHFRRLGKVAAPEH